MLSEDDSTGHTLPTTSIITNGEILRRQRFDFFQAPKDQSFLPLAPGRLPRSDPILSPDCAQVDFQSDQDLPTCVPLRSAVPRANAPPQLAQLAQLARGVWLPTSPNRSAHLQPDKTGLPGFPAPLPTWTWQRKEIPRRCSEISAVNIPGSSHTATRRLTGGSRGQRARP